MKAYLLFRGADANLDFKAPADPRLADLVTDLELDAVFDAMGGGDTYLHDVARGTLLASIGDPEAVAFRQAILTDCLEQPSAIRELYDISAQAIASEKTHWGWFRGYNVAGTLHSSRDALTMFVQHLRRLRAIADGPGRAFRSDGLRRFIAMLSEELSDQYLATLDQHLQRLASHGAIQLGAKLGPGNKGQDYVLRSPDLLEAGWLDRFKAWLEWRTGGRRNVFAFELGDRDEAGFRALGEIRDLGQRDVAIAFAHATEHLLAFFSMLRLELGFYVGCLNLHKRLRMFGAPASLPVARPLGDVRTAIRGLYDISLRLRTESPVVSNDLEATNRHLLLITGANRGGKSTFLRSLGQAQVMMQAGMFVPASSFEAGVCDAVFTHFKREEDAHMRYGKLEEELGRMRRIVDHLSRTSMVLLNESFASTNQREAAEIARQIVSALTEQGVRVSYVTHLYDLAHGFLLTKPDDTHFLRAERLEDGARSFRVIPGEPLPTSFGQDVFRRVFGEELDEVALGLPSPPRPRANATA